MEDTILEQNVLQKIVKNIPLGVVVSKEGMRRKVYYVNQAAYEIMGYSREEYIELVENGWAGFMDLDLRSVIRDNNEQIRSGEPFEVLSKTRTKAGEEKWLLSRVVVRMKEGPSCYVSYMDVTERMNQEQLQRQEQEALREQAARDSFTKLLNRGTMEQLICEALQGDEDTSECAYIAFDVDNFKKINDAYGHGMGDMLILKVADLLSEAFGEDAYIARMGGDEFAVFCQNVHEQDAVYQQAKYVLKELRKEREPMGFREAPTVSIGIAFGPEAGTSFAELYHRADEALYRVKNEQKNGISVYTFS